MNQTSRIKSYCDKFKGSVFDLNYLSKTTFKDIPIGNLRKYVTRLVEEGVLFQIAKGIFIIGSLSCSYDELIINHYLFSFGRVPIGMATGRYLLFLEGIIDDEPKIKTIMSKNTFLNRSIGNILINYVENDYSSKCGLLLKILELIRCQSILNKKETMELSVKLLGYLSEYNDSYFEHHEICHPRSVYIKLANLLKSMHISNRVMEIYETKKDIQHY